MSRTYVAFTTPRSLDNVSLFSQQPPLFLSDQYPTLTQWVFNNFVYRGVGEGAVIEVNSDVKGIKRLRHVKS